MTLSCSVRFPSLQERGQGGQETGSNWEHIWLCGWMWQQDGRAAWEEQVWGRNDGQMSWSACAEGPGGGLKLVLPLEGLRWGNGTVTSKEGACSSLRGPG